MTALEICLVVLVVALLALHVFSEALHEKSKKRNESDTPRPLTPPRWSGMTLLRWQSDDALTAFAAELFATREFGHAMEVVWSMHPLANLSPDTNADQQLGRIQGYRECIAVLEALARRNELAPADVPVDYSGDPFRDADDVAEATKND